MPGFFHPMSLGQQTPAAQVALGRRKTGGAKRRKRATKTAAAPRRRKKKAAAGAKLKKGSPAAKAWGAKMRRLRAKK